MDQHDPQAAPTDAAPGFDAGVEQLQVAAGEALKAARIFLDAAERVVADPDAIRAVLGNLGSMAKSATDAITLIAAEGLDRNRQSSPPESARRDDGFERIQVD